MVIRIVLAAVAAFVISSIWYVAFGGLLARLNPAYAGKAARWVPAAEVAWSLVLALVVAIGCDRLDLRGTGALVAAAVVAWVGFPVVLLAGAVLHERVPWRLAAVHAGDWLLKLVAVALIVGR
jgi:hypothetical protein